MLEPGRCCSLGDCLSGARSLAWGRRQQSPALASSAGRTLAVRPSLSILPLALLPPPSPVHASACCSSALVLATAASVAVNTTAVVGNRGVGPEFCLLLETIHPPIGPCAAYFGRWLTGLTMARRATTIQFHHYWTRCHRWRCCDHCGCCYLSVIITSQQHCVAVMILQLALRDSQR